MLSFTLLSSDVIHRRESSLEGGQKNSILRDVTVLKGRRRTDVIAASLSMKIK
jgi:hypothetical protein